MVLRVYCESSSLPHLWVRFLVSVCKSFSIVKRVFVGRLGEREREVGAETVEQVGSSSMMYIALCIAIYKYSLTIFCKYV